MSQMSTTLPSLPSWRHEWMTESPNSAAVVSAARARPRTVTLRACRRALTRAAALAPRRAYTRPSYAAHGRPLIRANTVSLRFFFPRWRTSRLAGLKCRFAHGQRELRPVTRHPKYKTQLCKTFSEQVRRFHEIHPPPHTSRRVIAPTDPAACSSMKIPPISRPACWRTTCKPSPWTTASAPLCRRR